MNSSMSLLFSSSVAISKWTRPTRFKRCLCLSAKPSTTTTTTSVVSEEEPTDNLVVISKTTTKRRKKINNNVIIRSKKDIEAELKEKWLDSLSTSSYASLSSTSPWVVGVDPDVSGAIALLKPVDGLSSAATCSAQFDPCYYCKKAPGRTASLLLGVNMGGMCNNDRHNNSSTILFDNPWTCSPIPARGLVWQKKRKFRTLIAELHSTVVFDSPHVTILIGNRSRRRLDAKSIVNLLKSFDAPVGTTAYVEQSIPFPQDGKQGWWSGGFGYGLWIGTLVALGFSVVPVPSLAWKNKFCLSGSRSSKDDSRELASTLFPTMCSLLKRKKDHGRAEALLIAAYGRGMKSTDLQGIPEDLM